MAAPETAGQACANSFSGETEVETREGRRPIEEIEVGDEVLAYDAESGENGYYPVLNLISHTDETVALLTIAGETLIATLDHPFYTLERGWQRVSELAPGDHVRRADGSYGVVSGVETIHLAQRMYNITVDWAHTYYVGDQAWLVHNAGACGDRNILRKNLGITDPNKVAHHLIPYKFRNHAIIKLAQKAGWNINHAYNDSTAKR